MGSCEPAWNFDLTLKGCHCLIRLKLLGCENDTVFTAAGLCEQQETGVTSPKPCLSLSAPFSWDATTFSLPASATQTSDTDSDSGFDSHDVRRHIT